MWRPASALAVGWIALTIDARESFAQEKKEPTIYVVKPGDTCAGIATRFYGDERRVDIIHDANRGMGPSPHNLTPGGKLILPPKPNDPDAGKPDATVTRIRNTVEITTTETRPAKGNDPLFRGNRVGTKTSSAADVTFRDETQVKIGENTLVVILGDTNARASRALGTDVTLVTGGLRARLSELAGGKRPEPRVTTDSGVVAMKDGEAQVTADELKTTRVAVYSGGSTLTAQKKTVTVNDGFGSKAVTDKVPTPPQPLPPAPEWSTAPAGLVVAHGPVELAFAYAPGTASGPATAQWHVQLARDAQFDDVVVDQRAPLDVRRVEAKNLGAGTYFARVSAIDGDKFEGKWSPVARTTVGRIGLEHLPHRRARLSLEGPGLTCGVDGSPVTFPIEIDRDRAHAIACTEGGTAAGSPATLGISTMPLGKAQISAEPVDPRGREGTLRVTVIDEFGERVGHLHPSFEPTADLRSGALRIGELRDSGTPGVYLAAYAWTSPPRPTPLRVRVTDDGVFDTNVVAFAAEAPPIPAQPKRAGLELGAAALGSWRGKPPLGVGFELDARATLFLPKGALFAGASGGYAKLLETTREGAPIDGAAISMRAFIGYRFGLGAIAPYVAIGPEVLRQSVEVAGVTGREWLLGATGSVGADLVAGPGAMFLEVRGRAVGPVSEEEPSLTASGGLLLLGYRLRL